MRTDVPGHGAANRAGHHALRDVGDPDDDTPPGAERVDRVQRAPGLREPAARRSTAPLAACARRHIGRWDAAQQVPHPSGDRLGPQPSPPHRPSIARPLAIGEPGSNLVGRRDHSLRYPTPHPPQPLRPKRPTALIGPRTAPACTSTRRAAQGSGDSGGRASPEPAGTPSPPAWSMTVTTSGSAPSTPSTKEADRECLRTDQGRPRLPPARNPRRDRTSESTYPDRLDEVPAQHLEEWRSRAGHDGTWCLDNDWWVTEGEVTSCSPSVLEHLRAHPRRPQALDALLAPQSRASWREVPTTVLLGRDDWMYPEAARVWAAERFDDVRSRRQRPLRPVPGP